MKRILAPGLALVILLSGIAAVPLQPTEAQSAGLVSSVLARLQKNHDTLKNLRASIYMEKFDAHIGEKDEYWGTVAYSPGEGKNANIKLEWTKPQHEILGILKGEYTLYRPGIGVVYKGLANGGKHRENDIFMVLNMSSAELQNKFQPFQDVRDETLKGGVNTTHLKLVPVKAMSFAYAEVWVDSSGMPVQMKVVEKNRDATTIGLWDLQKNGRLSDDVFVVKYPSSAKVIKG
jgi:outer membrane lipoprotein-sorting protein